jgi:hypothetical protein
MYVTGVGWVVVDIAPERSLDPPVSAPDPDLQRLLGEMARGDKPLPQGEEKLLEPVAAFGRALRLWLSRVLLVVLPLLLAFGYGVKLWRRLAPRFASETQAPRVAYRAEVDRLGEAQLRRKFGESREAFAERVRGQLPSFAALTRTHVAARYAAHAASDRAHLRTLTRAVRSELSQAVPFHRRVLGALHPFSWVSSR